MSKKYSLDVRASRDVEGTGNVLCYYSKGHHDPDSFADKTKYEHEYAIADHSQIRHTHMRMIPHPEFGSILEEVKAGESLRGAFPATVFDV